LVDMGLLGFSFDVCTKFCFCKWVPWTFLG